MYGVCDDKKGDLEVHPVVSQKADEPVSVACLMHESPVSWQFHHSVSKPAASWETDWEQSVSDETFVKADLILVNRLDKMMSL